MTFWHRPMTREARDTLWLLGALALALAPHAGHLPAWCSAGVAMALTWRCWLAWQDRALPPRWVLVLALLSAIALTWTSHRMLFGREAGVTLVVVLSGLKTLELRARRDAFVVTLLGFFLVLTQFMYSQNFLLAIAMAAAVWALMTSLILAQRPAGRPPLREAGREAGRALAYGIPLMVVLFLLFPRIGPLWRLPSDASGKTGLSDDLRLGQVASLALDDGIAMYVRFKGARPPAEALYFRGPVLDEFDGTTWKPSQLSVSGLSTDRISPTGPSIDYEVTLEPTQLRSTPLLEGTISATVSSPQQSGLMLASSGIDWFFTLPLQERVQLSAQVASLYRVLPTAPTEQMRIARHLPASFNPRTLAWARAFRARPEFSNASPTELAQAVLNHIRRGRFSYTLAPGDETTSQQAASPDQIDVFWLDRRSGFCEHFATAFVVVMRAMGIPSRVVTGYQGAELNPVSGVYVVRQSHAHAWAEYWQSDIGWVRIDPTGAVAPDRIQRSRPLRAPATGLQRALNGWDNALWQEARALWDAGNYRWNTWVLQYSRGQQSDLLGRLGWSTQNWEDLARALALGLSGVSLLGVGWLWLTRERDVRPSAWNPLLLRIERALARVGRRPESGWPRPVPASLWRQTLHQPRLPGAAALQPELWRAIDALLIELDAMRYGPGGASAPPPQARQMVRTIEQLCRSNEPPRGQQAHRH